MGDLTTGGSQLSPASGDFAATTNKARGPSARDQRGKGPRPAGRRTAWVAMLLVAGALVLVGVGAVLAARAAQRPPQPELQAGNVPLNKEAGDPDAFASHNSPVVARNPTDAANVVVANRTDNPDFGCALHVSFDAAASFTPSAVPVPNAEESKCFAPDVAFGPEGKLYVLFATLRGEGNRPHAVWLSTSSDGGETLSEPRRVLGELSFQVDLAVDPQQPGSVYLTWLDAEDTSTLAFPDTGYPVRFMSSRDSGQTWSTPSVVNDQDRERVVAPRAVVGPEGALQVVYVDLGEDRLDWAGAHGGRGGPPYEGQWELVAARSDDAGATWQETSVDTLRPPKRVVVFLPEFPALAVDRDRGRLYAAYHARVAGDADVWLWRSDDGGATWDGPTRVNDTSPDDGTAQYLPQLDVASTGRLDAIYYDRRADADNVANEVSLASSNDGGATFSQRLVLSNQPFDSRVGFGNVGMADLGSRLGLLSTSDRALAVWADTRHGTLASEKQDLVRQTVAFVGPDVPARWMQAPLRYGGGTVAAAGGLLGCGAVVAAWRRRRRDELASPVSS
jgi:hypothetical protein